MRPLIASAALSLFFLAVPGEATQAAPQSFAAPTYSSSSFVQELARLKGELDRTGASAETLHSYREALPKSWSVDAGGHHFEVPTEPLASRIAKAENQPELRRQQLEQAREYLDSLASETASLSKSSPAAPDSARSKLDTILARSEYSHARQESWFDRLRDRVSQLIFDALDRILGKVGGQKSFGYALLWIGIAGAVILIAYWVFRNWFRLARVEELALGAVSVPALSSQEWIFAAREAAARGDYRAAIHCAYWAGIARLQDMGALPPDRTKTPREYLGALRKAMLVDTQSTATRNQALANMTSRLEKTWYGFHVASEADFQDSLAQLEILGCRLR